MRLFFASFAQFMKTKVASVSASVKAAAFVSASASASAWGSKSAKNCDEILQKATERERGRDGECGRGREKQLEQMRPKYVCMTKRCLSRCCRCCCFCCRVGWPLARSVGWSHGRWGSLAGRQAARAAAGQVAQSTRSRKCPNGDKERERERGEMGRIKSPGRQNWLSM